MKHVCPWGRGLFGSILVLIGLTLVVPPLFGAGLDSIYGREELVGIIELNNRNIGELDEQLASIQAEIDWLDLKIKRLTDYGKVISSEMIRSMKLKKSKLDSVSRERARLAALAKEYGATLTRIDARLEREARELARREAAKKATPKLAETPAVKAKPAMIREADLPGPVDGVKIGFDELARAVRKAGLQDWVEVVGDGTCVRIENQLPILFASGKANLVKEYKSFLRKLARFLKPYDVRVVVDGYADSDPIRTARYPSNFELGATRAANIVHELVKNGLKPSVFKIASTGEYRFQAKKSSKRKLLERRAQVSVIFSG
ncbi:MAG: OmpA family protein [Desulfobacteraceae bacterium]|nr:OmpA family protein [Desulfobacteraceae bacterium]